MCLGGNRRWVPLAGGVFDPTSGLSAYDIFRSIPFVRFVKHDPFRFIVISPLLDLWIFSDSHAAEQIKKFDKEEGACRGLLWA